ncbi:MAG: ComEC/Rec2 family competence protein [Sphingobacteriia bacterium]|nr:MAG: ComEC/Rec2 family competence protein [Sphingobacteriia bacterium]
MSQYVSQIPWWRTALVRLTLALLLGMAMAVFFPLTEDALLFWAKPTRCLTLLGAALGMVLLRKKMGILQTSPLLEMQGFCLLVLMAGFGYLRYNWVARVPSPSAQIEITTPPMAKKKGWQARGQMLGGGGIWLYLSQDPALTGLGMGTVLVLTQLPRRIPPPKREAIESSGIERFPIAKSKTTLPNSFDFQRYAATQGIHYQANLRNNYRILGHRPMPATVLVLDKITQWVLANLKKFLPQAKDAGLAAALFMGQKQGLDPELVKAYRATGVLHVIAISGMHLALLAGGLQVMLRPLQRWRRGKFWVFGISLIFVWGFAALTGMGASVLRAALLLSLLSLARLHHHRLGLAHATAGAAALLLLWKPLWLLDIGCQLSFAAVLGIGILARPIENLLPLKNPLLQMAWQVSSASFAAQVFTLPLLLFYFHQFPALFWLGNLLAVPLSGLLLYLICALLVLAFVSLWQLAEWVGRACEVLLHGLNAFLLRLSRLPFAVWETPALSLGQVAALYVLLFALLWWQHKKQTRLSGHGL